jgi:hypothetical protein
MTTHPHASGPNDSDLLAQAREAMESVLARSAVDMEFRQLLLASPREALRVHFGRSIPEGLNVRFVESFGGATLVLPEPLSARERADARAAAAGGTAELLSPPRDRPSEPEPRD